MADTCSSCGKTIVWVKTIKDERMPIDSPSVGFVDPEGDLRGLFAIVMGRERVAYALSKLPAELVNKCIAWRTHFATCPNAADHRKS
jgi:hypothetical protein